MKTVEKADLAVIIGRFAPPHNSHKCLIQKALDVADNVLILVGSANSARTIKNPFDFRERESMLRKMFYGCKDSLHIQSIRDSHYSDDLWIAQVQEKVAALASEVADKEPEIVMVGNYSDESSYYLQYFPQWRKVPVQGTDNVHSTDIRNLLFDSSVESEAFLTHVPAELHEFLQEFRKSELCNTLSKEKNYIDGYKKEWANTPFPVAFVTVDNVVTCMGHVLVVKRKTHPGKGLYAMPGGFIRMDEFIEDAAIRELKEETGIRVDKPVLRKSIVARQVFDYPNRSLRGRTITHAFHIKLDNKPSLPEVRGSDDAERAFWMPFVDVYKLENEFFEDHGQIIQSFITLKG